MYTLFHSCIPHRRPYLEYANNIVGCFTVNNGAQKILVLGERGVLCATCEFMVHGTSHVSREGKVDNGGRSVSKRLRDERTCEACSGAHGGPLRRRRRREVEFFGVLFFFFFFWEFFNEVKIYIYIYIYYFKVTWQKIKAYLALTFYSKMNGELKKKMIYFEFVKKLMH
jgi:hypothetical protein